MKKLFKQISTIMLATALAVTSTVTPVLAASDGVNMHSPANDAALVLDMEGFQSFKSPAFSGKNIKHTEGMIIRQSRIEDGKIIIPKSGVYYTSRSGKAEVLNGWKYLLLGKEYIIVDNKVTLEVVKDVDVEKGGLIPLGSKGLELSSISVDGYGFDSPAATFQILKPSGNYYGSSFKVSPNAKLNDITTGVMSEGTSRAAGSYYPGTGADNFDFTEFYGTPVAPNGQSYLVADEVTKDGAHVVEFGTGAMYEVILTEKPALEMLLGKGETATLGDYTVTVTDITGNTASVELTDKDGKVTKKAFGPLTKESLEYLPADEVTRQHFLVRPEKDDVQLELDIFRDPFRDGKVALVGYTDLFKVTDGGKWPSDPQFVTRPDT